MCEQNLGITEQSYKTDINQMDEQLVGEESNGHNASEHQSNDKESKAIHRQSNDQKDSGRGTESFSSVLD